MSGFLLNSGSTVMCPHGAQAQLIPSSGRVMIDNEPAITVSDQAIVSGCPFTVPPPSPCIKVQWVQPAARVKIEGKPAVLQTSTGLCIAATGVPQGPPNIVNTQVRVKGS